LGTNKSDSSRVPDGQGDAHWQAILLGAGLTYDQAGIVRMVAKCPWPGVVQGRQSFGRPSGCPVSQAYVDRWSVGEPLAQILDRGNDLVGHGPEAEPPLHRQRLRELSRVLQHPRPHALALLGDQRVLLASESRAVAGHQRAAVHHLHDAYDRAQRQVAAVLGAEADVPRRSRWTSRHRWAYRTSSRHRHGVSFTGVAIMGCPSRPVTKGGRRRIGSAERGTAGEDIVPALAGPSAGETKCAGACPGNAPGLVLRRGALGELVVHGAVAGGWEATQVREDFLVGELGFGFMLITRDLKAGPGRGANHAEGVVLGASDSESFFLPYLLNFLSR